jgi:hypothetical protein
VGISPLAPDASVSLYPNPANSSFIVDYGSVNWSAVSELSLTVYNVLGAEVYQVKLGDYTAIHKVDVSSFASGMYVVSLKNRGERIWQSKVIKE